MKNKKLILATLVLLAVVFSGITFAYWASIDLSEDVDGNAIEVGTGKDTTVTASTSAISTPLVPATQAANSVENDAVEFVVFSFTVEYDTNDDDVNGTLAVLIDNVQLVGATHAGLVNTSFQIGGSAPVSGAPLPSTNNVAITSGTALTVYVVVTLDEPADQAAAEAIFGQDITFDVSFTVTP